MSSGGNFDSWLPQPSGSDIAKVRRGLAEMRRGGSRQFGLLGPSDDELATMRQQRGIPYAEAPSPMVGIGRGAMDAWEPVKQTYLNMFDPNRHKPIGSSAPKTSASISGACSLRIRNRASIQHEMIYGDHKLMRPSHYRSFSAGSAR